MIGRDEAAPLVFAAPWDALVGRVHQFGKHWSWRCGLITASHDDWAKGCQYDHTVNSHAELVAAVLAHLAEVHALHPVDSPGEWKAGFDLGWKARDLLAEAVTAGEHVAPSLMCPRCGAGKVWSNDEGSWCNGPPGGDDRQGCGAEWDVGGDPINLPWKPLDSPA